MTGTTRGARHCHVFGASSSRAKRWSGNRAPRPVARAAFDTLLKSFAECGDEGLSVPVALGIRDQHAEEFSIGTKWLETLKQVATQVTRVALVSPLPNLSACSM